MMRFVGHCTALYLLCVCVILCMNVMLIELRNEWVGGQQI